jgi:hypothetical protein
MAKDQLFRVAPPVYYGHLAAFALRGIQEMTAAFGA